MDDYVTTEKTKEFYKVFGLNSKGNRIYSCENGYNPYEWRSVEYSGNAVLFSRLKDAQYEADYAPKELKKITIEFVKVHTITQTKREVEIIEYEPKGLDPIIPF